MSTLKKFQVEVTACAFITVEATDEIDAKRAAVEEFDFEANNLDWELEAIIEVDEVEPSTR